MHSFHFVLLVFFLQRGGGKACIPLRPSDTGNIFVQLVGQHCCIASCPYYHPVLNFPRNKFQCCKLKKCFAKRRTRVYFAQHIAVTCNTCNAKTFLHKLNENVARITWLPVPEPFLSGLACSHVFVPFLMQNVAQF